MKGFTPVRTARIVAGCIALLGMFFLLIERVLATVLQMANEGVQMGLARYNNFTGRMAAQNFAEDKKLLSLLRDVDKMLPQADSALTVLMILAIVLLAVALVGLALPRQFGHVLVAVKLLKWQTEDAPLDGDGFAPALTDRQKKFALVGVGTLIVVVLAGFGISSCVSKVAEASVSSSVESMQEHMLEYIQNQRLYFGDKQSVGTAKYLGMPDSLDDDDFTYRLKGSKYEAVSKVALGACPAGAKWHVVATTKGFFTKDLVFYKSVPKDSLCAKLTPDFKSLGNVRKPESGK